MKKIKPIAKAIDWKKVWEEFDVWWNSKQVSKCVCCGQSKNSAPDWWVQVNKIQELVELQLKPKRRK